MTQEVPVGGIKHFRKNETTGKSPLTAQLHSAAL